MMRLNHLQRNSSRGLKEEQIYLKISGIKLAKLYDKELRHESSLLEGRELELRTRGLNWERAELEKG